MKFKKITTALLSVIFISGISLAAEEVEVNDSDLQNLQDEIVKVLDTVCEESEEGVLLQTKAEELEEAVLAQAEEEICAQTAGRASRKNVKSWVRKNKGLVLGATLLTAAAVVGGCYSCRCMKKSEKEQESIPLADLSSKGGSAGEKEVEAAQPIINVGE